jgi:hypothetical protein
LTKISAEAAKLKSKNAIDTVPENQLTLLINYAMRSLHTAKNFSAGPVSTNMFTFEVTTTDFFHSSRTHKKN